MATSVGSSAATSAGSAAGVATASAAATGGSAPLLPGLSGTAPRAMREQLGDEVRSPVSSASPAGGPKLGRNDPCYCGSGLKYKKCHGR